MCILLSPVILVTDMNIFWNVLHENVFPKEMIYEKKLSFGRKTRFAKTMMIWKYDAIYECM